MSAHRSTTAAEIAWQRGFADALNREMSADPRISNTALTELLQKGRPDGSNLTEDMVANWRRGRSKPRLIDLGWIVQALNSRPRAPDSEPLTVAGLLRQMGVLEPEPGDEELYAKAFRLQKLELKLRQAAVLASQATRAGAALVVQAAVVGGRWGVGVWPAYEGPDSDTRFHVSDRIDFRRLSDLKNVPTNEEIWADPDMKAALRAAYAVPSRAQPRWAADMNDGVPETGWSIVHMGIPRDPIVDTPWKGLEGGLCFIATTLDSRVTDVSALVSLLLGYGLTTTEDLAMEIVGTSHTRSSERWLPHQQLLRDPPRRRVWFHHGTFASEDGSPFGDPDSKSATRFVLLDESDELLREAWATDWPQSTVGDNFEDLRRTRDSYRELAAMMPDRVAVLDTRLFKDKKDKWRQVLVQTHCALQELQSRGVDLMADPVKQTISVATQRYPDIVVPLVNWLNGQGWPG